MRMCGARAALYSPSRKHDVSMLAVCYEECVEICCATAPLCVKCTMNVMYGVIHDAGMAGSERDRCQALSLTPLN